MLCRHKCSECSFPFIHTADRAGVMQGMILCNNCCISGHWVPRHDQSVCPRRGATWDSHYHSPGPTPSHSPILQIPHDCQDNRDDTDIIHLTLMFAQSPEKFAQQNNYWLLDRLCVGGGAVDDDDSRRRWWRWWQRLEPSPLCQLLASVRHLSAAPALAASQRTLSQTGDVNGWLSVRDQAVLPSASAKIRRIDPREILVEKLRKDPNCLLSKTRLFL